GPCTGENAGAAAGRAPAGTGCGGAPASTLSGRVPAPAVPAATRAPTGERCDAGTFSRRLRTTWYGRTRYASDAKPLQTWTSRVNGNTRNTVMPSTMCSLNTHPTCAIDSTAPGR